jgi:hypothetical protein
VGDDSNVTFGQKFPGEKGSVKWSIVVMQQPIILLPKFEAIFHAVVARHRSSIQN